MKIRHLTPVLLALALPAHAGLFDDDTARKEAARAHERLDKVEQTINNQRLVDLLTQIEQLKQEVAQLRGQLEVNTHEIDTGQKRQKDLYIDVDTRLRRLEPGGNPAAAGTPSAASAAATTPTDPGTGMVKLGDPANERKSYEAAFSLFRANNHQGAINAFNNFLLAYPQSQLAPNAQYWVGAAYSALKQPKQAIANQQKVVQNWPDSSKAPDAMLSMAANLLELGDVPAAKATYQELLKRYPISSAADIAKQRLVVLR